MRRFAPLACAAMCKSKRDTHASQPRPPSSLVSSATSTSRTTTTSASTTTTTTRSSSSTTVKVFLSDAPILYPHSEIRSATNNFLSHQERLRTTTSSSSNPPSWRCNLRGKPAVVFQLNLLFSDPSDVIPLRLSSFSRCHHKSLLRLLGASISPCSRSLFLAYDQPPASSSPLSLCLRNPHQPHYTALPSWSSRMQVAADVAQGLEYVHLHASAIHNRLTTSAILVTDPDLRARICHFGSAVLTGELDDNTTGSRRRRVDGTKGYMAPELLVGGRPSRESDVYAFGVVLMELMTGEEPVRYRLEGEVVEGVALVETARDVWRSEEGEERRRHLRRWVDRRLRDSFPLEVAERTLKVAIGCVDEDPNRRPVIVKVAGKMSGLLLASMEWAQKLKLPDITASMTPR